MKISPREILRILNNINILKKHFNNVYKIEKKIIYQRLNKAFEPINDIKHLNGLRTISTT
jgi:hypothetical protein